MFKRTTLVSLSGLLAVAVFTGGCRDAVAPEQPGLDVSVSAASTPTAVRGLGAIGDGLAVPFMDRQEFDFDVSAAPGSRLFVRDYRVVRMNGSVASLTADAAVDPATGISTVEQTSARCVTFGGTGRLDTGDLFEFSVEACDNGTPGADVDFVRISVPAISYNAADPLSEGEITLSDATKGDLDVTTVSKGLDIDPDGYSVTIEGSTSQAIGTDETVRVHALVQGSYAVQLSGVAANCAVSNANPRTVTVVAGAVASTTFEVTCTATTPGGTRVTGRGVIGDGLALPTMDRFELDFDVTSALDGRVLVTDYRIVRGDGEVGTMTVDHARDPATGVTSFSRSSATCVRFGGIGRLNDRAGGSLYDFVIDACDNASPGAGADTFSLTLPQRPYSKSGTLTQGDIAISPS